MKCDKAGTISDTRHARHSISFPHTLDGSCAYYVVVSKMQWKLFWPATSFYRQNGWLGGNYDVFAHAHF